MLDHEAALSVAAAFLEEHYRDYPSADPVRTVPESAVVDGSGLLVPWNSVAALDDGDVAEELGGNMPIRVGLATGRCRFLHVDEVGDYLRRGFAL
ncbi:hypothetical protein ACQP2P_11770 [Dactylosporangium sp. CA-139114]|uniref:hypothetical protein n=1 Tax=Dactylosporangium sp. CA-139114 TaxID=3239931 RepID=UPI003D96D18B